MAGQRGRDVLIKVGDGAVPETFTTVAGIRAKSIVLAATSVDGTTAESADAWRELIAGAGVKSATLEGAGVFKDVAADATVRALFFSQTTRSFQMIVPDFGRFEGPFQVQRLEYGGAHDGEATFEISLASAGRLTFVAI